MSADKVTADRLTSSKFPIVNLFGIWDFRLVCCLLFVVCCLFFSNKPLNCHVIYYGKSSKNDVEVL